MKILSGVTMERFNSRRNHVQYASIHGYEYIFDSIDRGLNSVYDHKIATILALNADNDWYFWLDDDAFFMQPHTQLESFLSALAPEIELIFPRSPVNLHGGWTYLSSGNFFFRNTPGVRAFFRGLLDLDLEVIREWWDEEALGLFTNGDQDKIVFALFHDETMSLKTQLVNFESFNTRPYHFQQFSDEHFLVHFAVQNLTKSEAIEEFRIKFMFRDDSLLHT